MSNLYSEREKMVSRDEVEQAVQTVASHLMKKAQERTKPSGAACGCKVTTHNGSFNPTCPLCKGTGNMNLARGEMTMETTIASIATSRAFCKLLVKALFVGLDRVEEVQEKQPRMSGTLPEEDRKRIHFHDLSWWFWDRRHTSRVGPYDTEDLAAQGLVDYTIRCEEEEQDKCQKSE